MTEEYEYELKMKEAEEFIYDVNKRYFTCKNDKSDKFWTVDFIDDAYYVHYGKNGTFGHIEVKYAESGTVAALVVKIIKEKIKKGYIEISASVSDSGVEAYKAQSRPVLDSMYFMFKDDIPIAYIAAVKSACDKYCDLVALAEGDIKLLTHAVKGLVLALNKITEETDIIETEERELLYDFITGALELAGWKPEDDITEEWREW